MISVYTLMVKTGVFTVQFPDQDSERDWRVTGTADAAAAVSPRQRKDFILREISRLELRERAEMAGEFL